MRTWMLSRQPALITSTRTQGQWITSLHYNTRGMEGIEGGGGGGEGVRFKKKVLICSKYFFLHPLQVECILKTLEPEKEDDVTDATVEHNHLLITLLQTSVEHLCSKYRSCVSLAHVIVRRGYTARCMAELSLHPSPSPISLFLYSHPLSPSPYFPPLLAPSTSPLSLPHLPPSLPPPLLTHLPLPSLYS